MFRTVGTKEEKKRGGGGDQQRGHMTEIIVMLSLCFVLQASVFGGGEGGEEG